MHDELPEIKVTNPLPYLFRKAWKHAKGDKWKIVGYWALYLIANTVTFIGGPYVFAKIVNTIQADNGVTYEHIRYLTYMLLLDIVFALIFWACHGPARVVETVTGYKVRARFCKHIIGGVIALPIAWHKENHTGNTVDKIKSGTCALEDFLAGSFVIISSSIRLLVSIFMIMKYCAAAGCVVIGMVGIAVWIIIRFDFIILPGYRKIRKFENEIAEHITDAVSNIMTVVTLRAEKYFQKTIGSKLDEPVDLIRKTQCKIETKWCLVSVCSSIMYVGVFSVYFSQYVGIQGGVLLGNIFLLQRYVLQVEDIFYNVASKYSDTIGYLAKLMNCDQIEKEFKPVKPEEKHLPEVWNTIRFEGLNFAYKNDEGERLHLDDISFELHSGETIAFVGGSGGGKTTAMSLMRGLYDVREGRVLVDGNEVPSGINGISHAVGLAPQQVEIFSGTVRYNITLGAPFDDKTIHHFAKIACFDDVIRDLPKGLESIINEDGVNLSGGQRQRLALLRSLLFNRAQTIGLLDEPTSSLDKKNERDAMRNILKSHSGKTVVTALHQLNLLPLFGRVIVFEKGKIAGDGTFDELLQNCPAFQRLWRSYKHED